MVQKHRLAGGRRSRKHRVRVETASLKDAYGCDGHGIRKLCHVVQAAVHAHLVFDEATHEIAVQAALRHNQKGLAKKKHNVIVDTLYTVGHRIGGGNILEKKSQRLCQFGCRNGIFRSRGLARLRITVNLQKVVTTRGRTVRKRAPHNGPLHKIPRRLPTLRKQIAVKVA